MSIADWEPEATIRIAWGWGRQRNDNVSAFQQADRTLPHKASVLSVVGVCFWQNTSHKTKYVFPDGL